MCASGLAAGCEHHEPPAWDAGTGSLSATPLPSAAPAVDAALEASAPEPDAPPVDPGALPQTKDRPHANTEAFAARSRALWGAIVQDDPDRAMPAFFPLAAYRQVKAIANPEADYKRRLVANFTRDIHRLHERLGAHAADATFLELEVASERARWIEPNEEGNKLSYWRVYGSKLRYEIGGNIASFDVTSLISWRGEWYVVHLSGFK